MKRIAAEEAWAPPEILQRYRKLLQEKPASWDPGFHSLWGFFLGGDALDRGHISHDPGMVSSREQA